jgi:ADP-ribose pyrophosphatase YjhB (NUDIX family)
MRKDASSETAVSSRAYPDRPFLAVSAAVIRDGHVLIVQRARGLGEGLYTLPGGVVEIGETLEEAVAREVREEVGVAVEPVGLAGEREVIVRDRDGRIARHFVILAFAARWIAGEPSTGAEISDARWMRPSEIGALRTTEGLAGIIARAFARMEAEG